MDVHVGSHIMHSCILSLLKSKTIVLITHHIYHLKYAQRIIEMEMGKIRRIVTPDVIHVEGKVEGKEEDPSREEETTTTTTTCTTSTSKEDEDDDHSAGALTSIESRERGAIRRRVSRC